MARRTALVAGATGIVGRHLIDRLAGYPDWRVVAVARDPAGLCNGVRAVALDLQDRDACFRALGGVDDVTHVFYAGRAPRPNQAEEAAVNTAMLVNLLDAVEPSAPALAHVNLVHGTKWYGSHLGPFRTPAREDDPRPDGVNFYYDQQDLVAARQKGKRWTWSALRPHFVCGVSTGHPHNLIGVIAVYASLCKALGRKLVFPGTEARWRTLTQLTDARLLADAMLWAATMPAAANRAFNVGNGDNVRWCHTWPKVAALFGLEAAPPDGTRVDAFLAGHAPLWDDLVRRHALAPRGLGDIADGAYGKGVFDIGWDEVISTVAIRRAGFTAAMDSESMIAEVIAGYRAAGLIPG